MIAEDLWIRNGRICNPEKIFFSEKIQADIKIDCRNLIIAPGFIDVQINGMNGRFPLCKCSGGGGAGYFSRFS